MYVRVGNSVFTEKSIDLNISVENLTVAGHLEYTDILNIRRVCFLRE
jgi:hypothetical protein